ncbi:hypothetical protein ACFX19_043679 [Malus domestica]
MTLRMAPTQRPDLQTQFVDLTHRPNMRTRQADPSHAENQLILSACQHKVDTCNEEYHEPSRLTTSTTFSRVNASPRAKPLAEQPHNEHRLQLSSLVTCDTSSRELLYVEHCLGLSTSSRHLAISARTWIRFEVSNQKTLLTEVLGTTVGTTHIGPQTLIHWASLPIPYDYVKGGAPYSIK